MKNAKLSGLIFSLTTFLPAVGQQQPQKAQPPVQQRQSSADEVVVVTTNLVQVDVVITDKNGRHVTDLQPSDFEIFEDKRKQQIANFSYINSDGASPGARVDKGSNSDSAAPAHMPATQAGRTIVIVVDDLGISFESMVSVREGLKKFVAEQMQSTDKVAITLTSKSIGSLQELTSDKDHLYKAIEQVRWFPGGYGGLSPFQSLDALQPEAIKGTGEVGQLKDGSRSTQVMSDLESARAVNYTIGTFGALSFVMRGLSEMPGRKAVVLVAESFRLFTNQGRNVQLLETLKRLTDQANLSSTVIYTLDASGLNPLTADASNNILGLSYTFDPKLLNPQAMDRSRPNDPPSLRSIARQEGGSSAAFKNLDELISLREHQNIESHSVLSLLAERTGGLFTRNTNDLSLGTKRMLEDQRGYYLIGYSPDQAVIDPSTGRRRYRDITVKAKRPGLRVRSREGYYGVAGEEARALRRTRDEQLAAALTSPFNAGGVNVRVTPLFFDDQTAGSYLRALLHVNARDLTFTEQPDGSRKTALDVIAVNFGENGRVADQFSDRQTIEAPAGAYEGLLRDGLSFVLNVPTKQPGSYQLRMAVRDAASSRVGAAGQYVQVPDLKQQGLTLSGIVLNGTEPKVIKTSQTGGTDSIPAAGKSESNNLREKADVTSRQFSPALRQVRQGMTLRYDYVIYNASPDSATAHPQLETQMRLLRDGKLVYAGTLMGVDTNQQKDQQRINAGGRVKIGPEFGPGEYVLQVVVKCTDFKDKPRVTTVTRSMDFEIVN